MGRVYCYYYLTASGRSPVEEFIDSLDIRSQKKFFFLRELLEEFGRKLPYPHVKYIGDDIFELRFYGGEGSIRVLYFFFDKEKAVFTNGFIKKTTKTPKNEKMVAIQRRIEIIGRQGGVL